MPASGRRDVETRHCARRQQVSVSALKPLWSAHLVPGRLGKSRQPKRALVSETPMGVIVMRKAFVVVMILIMSNRTNIIQE